MRATTICLMFIILTTSTLTATPHPHKLHSPDFEAFRRRFDEIEIFTNNCDKCRDITSQRKCGQLLPAGKSCDEPGYNYLKIFCRRTCDSCKPCNTEIRFPNHDAGEDVVYL